VIEHLSHSTLEDYATCGEKVRLRKIEKVPQKPGWALVGGSHVHAVTENLDLQDFGVPAEGPTSFSATWDQAVTEKEEESGYGREEWKASGRSSKAYPNKEDYGFWLDNGDTYVNNWRRFVTSSSYQVWIMPDGLPAIELGLEGMVGEVPVRGYCDRIMEDTRTGSLVVIDIKSGANRPKGPKQLVLYRHLLQRLFGPEVPLRYGAYYMVRDGVLTDPVDVESLDDGRLEHNYADAWEGIQAGRFIPSLSMLCGSCGVRDYCYEYGGSESASVLPYTPRSAA
jgi:hypothetical protein